jgi:nucleotide-binding universal stress UspA family protein
MKEILAPTDFSKQANNAVNYAAEIAKLTKSKLVLLHVYSLPLITGDVPDFMPIWSDVEKESMEELDRLKKMLKILYGTSLKIECVCKMDYSIEEVIKHYIAEKKIDLVIMGMRGAGYLSEKLLGSVTTSLILQSNCPVLVINEKVSFKKIKKMVLAYDYENSINKAVLTPLIEFSKLFNSQLFVLNVINSNKKSPSVKTELSEIKIETYLKEIKHTYHFIQNDDIVNGINDFVKSKKIEMIAIIHRKHKFLNSVFREGNTKKMAFHTSIPLLALHE